MQSSCLNILEQVHGSEDIHLRAYQQSMNTEIDTSSVVIRFQHNFLDICEEARLEQIALFSNDTNPKLLQKLYTEVGLDTSKYIAENVTVASMGTSSTQVYHNRGVIGAFYVGVTTLSSDPSLIVNMLKQIYSKMEELHINSPLVFCNAIGFLVNKNIRFHTISSDELVDAVSTKDLMAAEITGNAGSAQTII